MTDLIKETTTDEIGNSLPSQLTLTSKLILDEAFKRNIKIFIISAEKGLFVLQLGEKRISCCSSLSEHASAVAMQVCLDKSLTNTVLKKAHFKVPGQTIATTHKENREFFNKYKSVVTKPLDLSLGQGVSVDIRSLKEMDKAINHLREGGNETVLIEEYISGKDLRVVVIDYKFVAAVHRIPPQVTGDGKTTITQLVKDENSKAGRINKIPLNFETKRCVGLEGYAMRDILEEGVTIFVRKNTNEHTGSIPVDVTDRISPALRRISEKIADVLSIPVIGIDFFVPEIEGDDYSIIEVNSRPGLDGHEPQPVAEKFIDFLFPESVT